jgi:protein-tyrosine-phosphatase
VESAGVYDGGGVDPFVGPVLAEVGISIDEHEPRRFKTIDMTKFDVAIALTAEAAIELRQYLPRERIELWEIRNPSDAMGGRDAIIEAYRDVRDDLRRRVRKRFLDGAQKP